jgi:hypothetical protein
MSNDLDLTPENLDSMSQKRDYYKPDRAPNSDIHYNLRTTSYSSLLTLHSCPRRYELNRLSVRNYDPDIDPDSAGHLDFGSVVGNGVQELLVTRSIEKAYFKAFITWNDNLESERGLKSSKTFWHALIAISKFQEILNGPLAQYELAYYQGRPAIELGFSIDCGDGFTYRGKLDALLIHKIRREFLPLECKTSGWAYLDEAMYGNSSQGIGYGVVIDRVAHEMELEYNSYDIFYPVYMTKKMEWVPFRFPKNNSSRALWLQSLLLDMEHIRGYSEAGYFPQRGESCFSFGRQCTHYGTCHFRNELMFGPKLPEPRLDKIGEYPIEFSILDLVEGQVGKFSNKKE